MCQIFLFYHLCGHIHSKKIWRCSKEIENQLTLANMDQVAPRYPFQDTFTKSGPCMDCDGEETFLKPTLCEQCEQTGIISDWLKDDPAMRFEIVKEWLRSKRIERVASKSTRTNVATVKAAERGDGTESSISAKRRSCPRKTSREDSVSDVQVTNLEDFDTVFSEHFSPLSPKIPTELMPISIEAGMYPEPRLDTHGVMTPILADYLSKAETFEAEVEAVQQRLEKQSHDAKSTDDLRARANGIRMKIQALLTSLNHQAGHVSPDDDVEDGKQCGEGRH